MASKAASSPSASANRLDAPADPSAPRPLETVPAVKEIANVIDGFKKEVAADRAVIIRKRIEENRRELAGVTEKIFNSSKQRNDPTCDNITGNSVDLLTKRQADALGMQNGIDANNGDRDSNDYLEDAHASTAVLLGSSIPVKNAVRPIKLPEVKRLPPYTTWIFLDRNQRMTEDQSVVGRRRIYYDQNGGEALICSDSEEEAIDEEEDKREFVDSEDFILRMTIKELGLSDSVLESLANCLSRSPSELKARYEVLIKEEKDVGGSKNGDNEETSQTMSSFLDKDLDAALDSFDNLFCRRCLVFDCRLHGCSQDLVLPALKLVKGATVSSPGSGDPEDKSNPSSNGSKSHVLTRKKSASSSDRSRLKQCQSESASSNAKNASESSDSETGPRQDGSARVLSPRKTKSAGKGGLRKRNSKRVAERVLVCLRKRQKMMASDSDSIASGSLLSGEMKLRSKLQKENEDATSSSQKKLKCPVIGRPRRKDVTIEESHNLVQGEVPDAPSSEMTIDPPPANNNDTSRKEEFVDENTCKQELSEDRSWKALEKGLYEKGLEIFGRNSCLIARNLLNGLKTCQEIFQYMNCSENKLICQGGDAANYLGEGYPKFDSNGNVVHIEPRRRSRFLRRRGRVRRLKYTWKSAAYHSIRKRITERKDQPCRQYNPCNCQTACGKQCSCLLNGTCCEKYCGCPKSCKNRFRGCHCAKNQCRSRQCPCFAADRECDPDVCRNCWVSCGDGTLGVPNQRGDNYECRNMKLLLKQQQRVLLGRSDVSGWGAFLKNSVSKHEYLGEYTGELISHREADKRGKIYDRENSSFLFNLNDQFVLDAYRKGDKLKFANHSPDPNCYAKVIMVAGDHRVGIFAKERINAGEELFYDYRYEPDRAPAWARKPEAAGSKKEEGAPSNGRAKKLA
ncbi:histone-lysine N-methyltransferase CLF isoform X2 [Eucalyptus grandis]|uniref:histone-lysine N-methyltransferase CLF isoform X2 n=1 Tax=Eucalyptus grandis TaxID=71139 RepID=UPI00192EC959|nr:histone-lysine N-methyltransferase CLF isoform X2 [Eucalyptus grandis]